MSTTLRCLLLALLWSAWADDLWALATPDPSDDVTATEDNDYIPPTRSQPDTRPRNTADTRLAAVRKPDAAHSTVALLSDRFTGTDSRPYYCPELLYTLMSLQR